MTKKGLLLGFAVLLAFAIPASAQVITNAQPIWSVVKYQTSCSSTTIGITASELTSNTTAAQTTGGISNVKVTNVNTNADIYCGSSSGVTAGTGASTDGEKIARSASATAQPNFLAWAISIGQKWYCIATVASTGATVCKVR